MCVNSYFYDESQVVSCSMLWMVIFRLPDLSYEVRVARGMYIYRIWNLEINTARDGAMSCANFC